MIVGIMQPYFFPYIGYFQLMDAVDCFVFYDDVQYVKHRWMNRNRILINGGAAWITLTAVDASHQLSINERHYWNLDQQRAAILRKLRFAYGRAPYFNEAIILIEACMDCDDPNISNFNQHSLRVLASALGIECRFETASKLDFPKQLKGHERVIAVCRCLGATQYINAAGGVDLYGQQPFAAAGIDLRFIATDAISYPQFGGPHVPFLSIIDVLMFNSNATVRELLGRRRKFTADEIAAAYPKLTP